MPQVHLVRRGLTYYFRAALPDFVSKIVGQREIKISLHTSDLIFARMRARMMSNAVESFIRSTKTMTSGMSNAFNAEVKDHFQGLLNKSRETALLLPQDADADINAEIASLQASHTQIQQRLANQQFSQFEKDEAAELLERADPRAPKADLETLRLASNAVLRAQLENIRILIAQLQGNYGDIAPRDPLFAGMSANALPPIPGEVPVKKHIEPTLSECAERFISFKNKGDWGSKTEADHRRTMNLACAVIGSDRAIRTVGVEEKKQLRDALAKLPKNWMKTKGNANLSVKDVLAANGDGPKLSVKTQEKYLNMFSGLLHWCHQEGLIANVPGKGVKVAGAGKQGSEPQREPYSPAQVVKIFSSPLFVGYKSDSVRHEPGNLLIRDGKFWVPLIAAHSGMRLSEIVQLQIPDIKTENGIFYFDVSKGEDKSLKTSGSKRRIPVHAVLIALGFLDYWKSLSGQGRIFPEIKKGSDKSYSSVFSKWWTRYSRRAGFKTPKTAFHSFRHNFLDALRAAGEPQYVNEALLGHSNTSVHSKYGSGPTLAQLKKAVDKVEYSVDFSIIKAFSNLPGELLGH